MSNPPSSRRRASLLAVVAALAGAIAVGVWVTARPAGATSAFTPAVLGDEPPGSVVQAREDRDLAVALAVRPTARRLLLVATVLGQAVAPDRLRITSDNGTKAVVVGSRRWDRVGSGPWQSSTQQAFPAIALTSTAPSTRPSRSATRPRGLMWVGGAAGEGLSQGAWPIRPVPRLVALVPDEADTIRRAQTPIQTCH